VSADATLVVLAGSRFDLGVAAARVRRVVSAAEGEGGETMDLFALLGALAPRSIARLVGVALSDGSELFIATYAGVEVLTPRTLLALPRIVTRRAPWLDALVLDGARPLYVIAPDRLRGGRPFTETAPLW
jgi:hypothetical protein